MPAYRRRLQPLLGYPKPPGHGAIALAKTSRLAE
jgi:hypothetical protein